MEYPSDFMCPISMELMSDPVTIATGITYERKNVEKWFYAYKKTTCPATMQQIDNFDITPNHTLKRLILAWPSSSEPNTVSSPARPSTSSSPTRDREELMALLTAVESSPFKVTALKKLKGIVEANIEDAGAALVRSGGVEVLVQIMVQVLVADHGSDFGSFRACEEALGVVQLLPVSKDKKVLETLLKPEAMKSMAIMLQRGSAESRLHAITIFLKMARTDIELNFGLVVQDYGVDLFKSILELASDEICTKASSRALDVLVETLGASKKSRLKAIEAGAVHVLIDILPDSNRSRCEKILILLKLLAECAEGRLAIVEHGMGIAAVTKRLLMVSNAATKLGVKILWQICSFSVASERMVEEMVVYGAVTKLVSLLHMDGWSSTKDKVIQMFKLHGNTWKRYSCFPSELKGYLGNST